MRRRTIIISGAVVLMLATLVIVDQRLRMVTIPQASQPLQTVAEPATNSLAHEPVSAEDILAIARDRWQRIDNYKCTITSVNLMGNKLNHNVLAVMYKRPSHFRHMIVEGHNRGVLLTYDGKIVHARPGGLLSLMTVTMDPSDQRLIDGRGRPFFESDWGSELNRCSQVVAEGGTLARKPDEVIDEEPCWVIEAQTPGPVQDVSELWLSQKTQLVKRVVNRRRGEVLRDARYSNVALNTSLNDSEFMLK